MTNSLYSSCFAYEPPRPAPEEGCEWTDFADYPGVRAEITLSSTEDGYIHPSLQGLHSVCGEPCRDCWGSRCGPTARSKFQIFRASTLLAAEAEARAWVAAQIAVLTQVLSLREARLARRAETIRAAHESHGEIVAP